MPDPIPSPLGTTLHAAIADVRRRTGDPVAPVAILVPSTANGVLAKQQLALAGDLIRVEFLTPEQLLRELGRATLALSGFRPQPASWVQSTVGALIRTDPDALGRFGPTLARSGWAAAIARAIDTLETAGITPDDLATLDLPDHRERLDLLATLLGEVAQRRAAEELYAPSALCAAARDQAHHPRWAAAVVLGDRLLGPREHDALRAWLAARPHAEVVLPPWHRLDPAPVGLRAALPADHAVHTVPSPPRPALAALGDRLFGEPQRPSAPDESVVFARTPDDVRDLGEATREVLAAIDTGTPLDRIAVVLPDAQQVTVLRGHFERAGIPATWLVGPPLASTPAAGFLLHLLDLATGDDTVPSWYELLRQPGLRLRTAVSAEVTQGRGRWRRILSRSGAVRGTSTIQRAVAAWASAVEDESFEPEGNRRAADHLLRAMEVLEQAMAPLREPATLGTHGRRWAELLRAWWVRSADREHLLGVLAGWGPPDLGPRVPLSVALGQLREALAEQAMAPDGSLNDPAVRVATPMTLLGGAFDVVVATGLSEGRLPRRPAEDALLPDDVLDALREHVGVPLLTSRDLRSFEVRRFAALVSAATRRLWLSAPASELLKERPLLPSSFLLDTATVFLGRRARYTDLAALQVRAGSRARPWPERPDDAISRLEHRVATVAADPATALPRLIRHATGARLVAMHRAFTLGEPSPHTGLVPPEVLAVPGLVGEPQSTWDLVRLAQNPARYLLSTLLGVRRLQRLFASSEELSASWRERRLLAAIATLDAAPRDDRDGILRAWDDDVATWRAFRDDVSDTDLAMARRLTVQALDSLVPSLPHGGRQPVTGPIDPDLPWVLDATLGWCDGEVLAQVQSKRPARGRIARDATDALLVALAHRGVDEIVVVTPTGTVRDDVQSAASDLLPRLHAITAALRDGWFPATDRTAVHLSGDPTFDYEDHPL